MSTMCGDSGSSLRARRTSSGRFGRVSIRSKSSSLGLRSCCSSRAGAAESGCEALARASTRAWRGPGCRPLTGTDHRTQSYGTPPSTSAQGPGSTCRCAGAGSPNGTAQHADDGPPARVDASSRRTAQQRASWRSLGGLVAGDLPAGVASAPRAAPLTTARSRATASFLDERPVGSGTGSGPRSWNHPTTTETAASEQARGVGSPGLDEARESRMVPKR